MEIPLEKPSESKNIHQNVFRQQFFYNNGTCTAHSVRNKPFLAGSKYLLPGVKVGSKINILGSKIWWPYNSPLAICIGSFQI